MHAIVSMSVTLFFVFFLFERLAFMESVKVTNSRNAVKFQKVGKSCFHDNSSAILDSWSDVTRMKCAIECVALSDCVAWIGRLHNIHPNLVALGELIMT